MTAIEFDKVGFSYPGGARALDGLSLSIGAGEFVCVLGSNGSGKSTFAKHVNALLVPDEGTVRVFGRDTADPAGVFAIRSSAGMVFQNPDDQIVASVVEDDVAFGPGNLGVGEAELRERVARALERVGLAGFGKAETAALSGGQKQLVAIAGALALQPRILVLDEASAMLDPRGRASLLDVCRDLNAAGLTIVFVTHFMEEAARASRVVVLDGGRVALDGTPRDVLTQADRLGELGLEAPYAVRASQGKHLTIDEVVAHAAELRFPYRPAAPEPVRYGPAVLTLDHVSYEYRSWALRDISLEVCQGEVFGIAGHTGSGKSTLAQVAGGLLEPSAGSVSSKGRREVGVVFQFPERQLFAATVFDDVAFGPRNLGLDEAEVEARVAEALELVHLDPANLRDKSPFSLSGGQQRRVALAGVLAMRPGVLVLDEPGAGLDPQSRKALLALIGELHASGRTVVIVSHDMDDLARLCDRIAVLNEGRLEAVGTPQDVFSDEARMRAIGLDIPQFMQLANALARS